MKRYAMNILSAVAMIAAVLLGAGCEKEVREPAVAGAFYPADAAKLEMMVDGYLQAAEKKEAGGELVALIAPHAGYVYSGGVAAYSYKQVEGADYDTVIVAGPSHKYPFNGASVWAGDAVKTPLGEIPVDKEVAESLISPEDNVVYEPKAHKDEHSVEVQFPFIQKSLPDAKVVPVVIGSPDRAAMDRLALKIAVLMEHSGKKVLLIASTDWSHYRDYETTKSMDSMAIESVKNLSGLELMIRAQRKQVELCGLYPVLLALDVADRLHADRAELFRYANSGDVTGEHKSVVGYAAMGIYKTGGAGIPELTSGQKEKLLKIARDTVESYVKTKNMPEIDMQDPALMSHYGAFVTLKRQGMLRGCIGNFFSDGPLYETVENMAVNAAVRDRRFRPVSAQELDDIEVEISVLSPLRRVFSMDEIEVGKHGIYLIKGRNAGVLLPQVAVENGWDRETFLQETCRKAGLGPDDWKEGAEIYTFTAQVFGESDTLRKTAH